MSKTYLRYEPKHKLGLVATSGSNAELDPTGRLALAPALEDVIVWNAKQGVEINILSGQKATVTCIRLSPDELHLAVGYHDGSIRIWKLNDGECKTTFQGHKSAVTCISFNADGSLMASGARDTDVVVWDPLGETGLYRLKGHKGDITDLKFCRAKKYLLSSSKDTFIRVWDLDTQHCVETVVGHHNEVWSFDINPEETHLVTGSSDSELRVFKLDLSLSPNEVASTGDVSHRIVSLYGSLPRSSKQRVVQVRFEPFHGNLLAVHSADKVIQFFRVGSSASAQKKRKRRIKRRKEKVKGTTADGDLGDMSEEVCVEDEYTSLSPLRLSKKIRSISFHGHHDPCRKTVFDGKLMGEKEGGRGREGGSGGSGGRES